MAKRSEDVLLIVENVKHKKAEGSLYLMDSRICWMAKNADKFEITHNYADIKSQRVSPDGKAKVQLQIVLHTNGTTAFQFVSPKGLEMQLKDREDVKEMLLQLLPRFKKKISNDILEKNKILEENPELCLLYKDLVTTEIITADEFWTELVPMRGLNNNLHQSVGISGSFLSNIVHQDGCNGIKYNITADTIQVILTKFNIL